MGLFGLIGTITADEISDDSGRVLRGVGGILYQAAYLCGRGESVRLFANCGEDLRSEVEALVASWPTLDRSRLAFVPGPGNRVSLRYSESLKEREEVLASVVPPLDPRRVLAGLDRVDFLLQVFNSGFDLTKHAWREIAAAAPCPVWLDVHSLALDRVTGVRRGYVAIPAWREWIEGADYLQANRQELASLMGRPERWPDGGEILAFSREAFAAGVKAVFVTLGKAGVLALTPVESRLLPAARAGRVVDTTGCGDVFAAESARGLAAGLPVFEAAAAGVTAATRAVEAAGIRATFELGAAAAAG